MLLYTPIFVFNNDGEIGLSEIMEEVKLSEDYNFDNCKIGETILGFGINYQIPDDLIILRTLNNMEFEKIQLFISNVNVGYG